jgi:hypothetical protein
MTPGRKTCNLYAFGGKNFQGEVWSESEVSDLVTMPRPEETWSLSV